MFLILSLSKLTIKTESRKVSCTGTSTLWVHLLVSSEILSIQPDTSISYILSNNIFTNFHAFVSKPRSHFFGGQFENQEINLTKGDCNGKWCLGIKSLRYHFFWSLAHLSQRLQDELIVYQWSVIRPSSSIVHTFRLEYLWSQLANFDQILCVASLGWGKGCIKFWGRLAQNSGFHGNWKPLLTYNEENDVSTFSRLFLIWSFLYLQVKRTCIKSRMSSNFCWIGPLTTELAALEHLKKFP